MFEFLKKKIDCKIFAPVTGKMIPLSKASDKVFASGMMGKGVAFEFDGDTIYSPCDCEVIMIAAASHAIGFKSVNKTELLLHVGFDTVNLNGQGFEMLVKINDKVKAHQPIMKINRIFMKENKIDLTMPLVITNLDDYEIEIKNVIDTELNTLVIKTKK